jgi:DNA-binding MarR family transcriptional regulator
LQYAIVALVNANREGEADRLVTALLTASRALVGVSVRSLSDVEDAVTLTQFRALVVLRSRGRTRQKALADRLGVNASSALRLVDRLVAAGMVTRADVEGDRRAVDLELTDRGRHLVDTVTARRRAAIAEVVEAMPPGRRRGLVAALSAFAEAADEPATDGDVLADW